MVEIKDVELPDQMRRAMAREAESERERRAKVIHARGELEAAESLGQAAVQLDAHPGALQLRTLSTLAEIAVEKNSTIVFPFVLRRHACRRRDRPPATAAIRLRRRSSRKR
jgi:regulator of protease activity HflC (stomatin/prohibitin superfamily)